MMAYQPFLNFFSGAFACPMCQQALQWSDTTVCQVCRERLDAVLMAKEQGCVSCGRISVALPGCPCIFCWSLPKVWDKLHFLWRSSSLSYAWLSRLKRQNVDAWASLVAQYTLRYWREGMDGRLMKAKDQGDRVLFGAFPRLIDPNLLLAQRLWAAVSKHFEKHSVPCAVACGKRHWQACRHAKRIFVFQYQLLEGLQLGKVLRTLKKFFPQSQIEVLVVLNSN